MSGLDRLALARVTGGAATAQLRELVKALKTHDIATLEKFVDRSMNLSALAEMPVAKSARGWLDDSNIATVAKRLLEKAR